MALLYLTNLIWRLTACWQDMNCSVMLYVRLYSYQRAVLTKNTAIEVGTNYDYHDAGVYW